VIGEAWFVDLGPFAFGVPQESWALKQECKILLRSMPHGEA